MMSDLQEQGTVIHQWSLRASNEGASVKYDKECVAVV